jgi:hypothetical protein
MYTFLEGRAFVPALKCADVPRQTRVEADAGLKRLKAAESGAAPPLQIDSRYRFQVLISEC